MKSAQFKKELILLEEKLLNLVESGTMTPKEFCLKTKSSRQWFYEWRNGNREKAGKKKHITCEKILDMASKLGM